MRYVRKFFLGAFVLFPLCNFAQLALSQVFAPKPFLPNSTVLPVPGSSITFTQIMFEHPSVDKANRYVLKIYEVQGKDSVLVKEVTDSSTATLLEGFEFGKTYRWNYTAYGKKKKPLAKSATYKFSILPLPWNNRRVNVITNDTVNNAGGLISFDYAEWIVNRWGQIVWFLPEAPAKEYIYDDQVRDLRLTFAGTVIFTTERDAFEISIDGRILWRGHEHTNVPKNNIENFHHAIDRLPNGNIVVLGNHTVDLQRDGDTAVYHCLFGVIGEYNKLGKLVWKWDSYNYFRREDLFYKKTPDGRPDVSTHLNAFEVDDSAKYVYAGFRDMNRIVKIDRATGNAVMSYGDAMPSGDAPTGNNFFWKQHDITLLKDGSLAVFNNDSIADPKVSSSIVVFSQANKGEQSQVTWSFNCLYDTLADGRSEKGGNVDQLNNGNLLVNMGSLNRCIEITSNKKIVWDVLVESRTSDTSQWTAFHQYRSHYTSSLYPCYFSVTMTANSSTLVGLDIFNEGTEADQYTVEYKVGTDQWVKAATTVVLQPGQKSTVNLERSKTNNFTDIRITSVKNPEFNRVVFARQKK